MMCWKELPMKDCGVAHLICHFINLFTVQMMWMSETQMCVHYDLPAGDVMLLYLIQKPGDMIVTQENSPIVHSLCTFQVLLYLFIYLFFTKKPDTKNRLNIFEGTWQDAWDRSVLHKEEKEHSKLQSKNKPTNSSHFLILSRVKSMTQSGSRWKKREEKAQDKQVTDQWGKLFWEDESKREIQSKYTSWIRITTHPSIHSVVGDTI